MGFSAGIPTERLGHYEERAYPDPIVPRRLVRELPERVDQAGRVLQALDEAATRRAIEELVVEGVEAIAVSLLWAFRNPAHEQRVGELVREIAGDGVFLSLSSDVNPVIGEYERTATTVLNSYLGPSVDRYLARLEAALREHGFAGTFAVLTSNGGVLGAQEAASHSVQLLASGPAGGVIGSRYLADSLGHRNIITSDMGGTSFDVGLVVEGRPVVAAVSEVAKYHVSAPMIDITAIGAGGGSIASVRDGLIRVGPESAGAYPGPVCYGRGGQRVTVTDAMLVLGIIDADRFLGGRMQLDRAAAEAAIEEQIADPLGLSVAQAAAGVRRIVEAHMADTLRELTVGRGHDPRDFVLYAYGGAGPMHCAGYGAELGVQRIVVPAMSMAQSAYGALASDVQVSAEQSVLVRGGGGERDPWDGMDVDVIEAAFAELEQRCRVRLAANGVAPERAELSRVADVRYRRQTNELMIQAPIGRLDAGGLQDLLERFERAYEETYGKGAAFREAGVEIATLRVNAVGRTQKPRIARLAAEAAGPARHRDVFDAAAGRHVSTPVVDWAGLVAGHELRGPAVVEHPTTTVYVAAGQGAGVDEHGNLIITTGSATA
jgi:N-methylhydantoinase A